MPWAHGCARTAADDLSRGRGERAERFWPSTVNNARAFDATRITRDLRNSFFSSSTRTRALSRFSEVSTYIRLSALESFP